jgi:hypothetical protein
VYTESDIGSISKSPPVQNLSSSGAGNSGQLIQATTSSQLSHAVQLIQTVPVTNQSSIN